MKMITKRENYTSAVKKDGWFPLVENGTAVCLLVAENDWPGVKRVAGFLQKDILEITGSKPLVSENPAASGNLAVIAGTLGHSSFIDVLVKNGKLDTSLIKGKWDSFLLQVVDSPIEGIDKAFVIAGSSKRGTIFGMYDLSSRAGVSPWHWFADVPVKKQEEIFISPEVMLSGEPSVKYRGFFINDEYPCLGELAKEKFGGFTSKFYIHVFDLLLRMKGNYFWPAMWDDCFHDDDPLSTEIADEMGVIMGTSHHEPLMRAWKEWQRYGKGEWNLETNMEYIKKYWKDSVTRQGDRECIMTVGMRGDGDEPLTEGSKEDLLLDILNTQRSILKEVCGREPEEIPQMWAVYKEVQEYYDKGAKIPDDILVMLCDDNWGNIRKLPRKDELERKGGHGLYYHFDYVGGPRNYKWINSSPLPRVREQLSLAYEGGIDRLWIVNVGDIKPCEFPLSFFMDFAWNLDEWDCDQLDEYTRLWAQQQFGPDYAEGIAMIITEYAKFNGRRKPEMLAPDTYSLVNYREAEKVVDDYNDLAAKVLQIKEQLPAEYHDAYYELVEFPVLACANLNELHVSTARNHLYAAQGRVSANNWADKVKDCFKKDREIADYYNRQTAGGKWNHMASQPHISYTYWQSPDKDVLPELKSVVPDSKADIGVAVEGSEESWPGSSKKAELPEFSSFGRSRHYLEIFRRGKGKVSYKIETEADWLIINKLQGEAEKDERVWIEIDWQKAPEGKADASLTVVSGKIKVQAFIIAINYSKKALGTETSFIEAGGFVAIEAEHFADKQESSDVRWQVLPGMGRTLSGITSYPVDKIIEKPEGGSPNISYNVWLASSGEIKLTVYLCPTNNFKTDNSGLRYAVSIDDEKPKIVNIHSKEAREDWKNPITTNLDWNDAVGNNIRKITTTHKISENGKHVIRYWLVDPGVVLQKLVIWTGKEKDSYLGPPESHFGSYPKEI